MDGAIERRAARSRVARFACSSPHRPASFEPFLDFMSPSPLFQSNPSPNSVSLGHLGDSPTFLYLCVPVRRPLQIVVSGLCGSQNSRFGRLNLSPERARSASSGTVPNGLQDSRLGAFRGHERPRDPRSYQIAVLRDSIAYAFFGSSSTSVSRRCSVTFALGAPVQYACTRIWNLPRFDPKSACISAISLCLLLRTDSLLLAALAAAHQHREQVRHSRSMASTSSTRPTWASWRCCSRPTRSWVSPGQWGNVALLAG